jgi:hypothetical protein
VVQLPVSPPQPVVHATGTSRGMSAGCGVLIVLFILLTVGLPLYLAGNELLPRPGRRRLISARCCPSWRVPHRPSPTLL